MAGLNLIWSLQMLPFHAGAVPLIWVALLTSFSSLFVGTACPFVNNGLSPSQDEARQSRTAIYQTRFPGVLWNNDLWQITTTNLDQGHYQSRMSLSNGYIGINVASLGPFFDVDLPVDGDDINNWPTYDRRQTFATVASFWDSDSTGVSLISGIPHWAGIYMIANGYNLTSTTPKSEISEFSSQLDMKRGLMNWSFNWTPTQYSASYAITYEMLVHRLHINQALIKMTVTPSETSTVDFINAVQGDCAVRSTFVESGTDSNLLYTAVQPIGVSNITAYTYSSLSGPSGLASSPVILGPSELIGFNASSIGQSYKQQLTAGRTFTVTKYVGIASSDAFKNPRLTARNAAIQAAQNGYSASRASHIAEWAVAFPASSVDDFTDPATGALPDDQYIQEQAILSVATPFYLLQNLPSENALAAIPNAPINDHSIAVGGLGSATYAGMIFWDADLWMHPGLAASFPNAARGIANYRANKLDQAKLNIAFAASSTQKNKTFSENSAVYPWVSGRYGNCTAYGACFDYEYHLNGDIALMLSNQYVITGDEATFKDRYFPVIDALANFFGDVLTKNGSTYELTYMTDPDEYANGVNNGGFTMPLIAETMDRANQFRNMLGIEQNSTWVNQAANVVIPLDPTSGISLEYSGMTGITDIKQVDVILKIYPLNYFVNYTNAEALIDLRYYAMKQIQQGPAMTYAIFAVAANQVSDQGCSAYTYQQYSSYPYVRAPWFQFSEQMIDDYHFNGNYHPAFPFLTGHGGANQVVLFGYLGLRLTPDGNLHIAPSLPPQFPQIRYRKFYWQGWPISAISTSKETTLTRSTTPLANANKKYASGPIPVVVGRSGDAQKTYSLQPGKSITVPNRQISDSIAVTGNVLQCATTVASNTDFEPGQFPIGAIDGDTSTLWQPVSASNISTITVKIPNGHVGKHIKSLYFNWGSMPPVQFSVFGADSASPQQSSSTLIAKDVPVIISQPFNASTVVNVVLLQGNETKFTPKGQFKVPKYVTLSIIGNQVQGPDNSTMGLGASVAEWALISS